MNDYSALQASLQTAMQSLLVTKGVTEEDAALLTVDLKIDEKYGHASMHFGINQPELDRLELAADEAQRENIRSLNPDRPRDAFHKKWGYHTVDFGAAAYAPFANHDNQQFYNKINYPKGEGAVLSKLISYHGLADGMHVHPALRLLTDQNPRHPSISANSYENFGIPKLQLLILSLNETVLKPAGVAAIDTNLIGLTQGQANDILEKLNTPTKAETPSPSTTIEKPGLQNDGKDVSGEAPEQGPEIG